MRKRKHKEEEKESSFTKPVTSSRIIPRPPVSKSSFVPPRVTRRSRIQKQSKKEHLATELVVIVETSYLGRIVPRRFKIHFGNLRPPRNGDWACTDKEELTKILREQRINQCDYVDGNVDVDSNPSEPNSRSKKKHRNKRRGKKTCKNKKFVEDLLPGSGDDYVVDEILDIGIFGQTIGCLIKWNQDGSETWECLNLCNCQKLVDAYWQSRIASCTVLRTPESHRSCCTWTLEHEKFMNICYVLGKNLETQTCKRSEKAHIPYVKLLDIRRNEHDLFFLIVYAAHGRYVLHWAGLEEMNSSDIPMIHTFVRQAISRLCSVHSHFLNNCLETFRHVTSMNDYYRVLDLLYPFVFSNLPSDYEFSDPTERQGPEEVIEYDGPILSESSDHWELTPSGVLARNKMYFPRCSFFSRFSPIEFTHVILFNRIIYIESPYIIWQIVERCLIRIDESLTCEAEVYFSDHLVSLLSRGDAAIRNGEEIGEYYEIVEECEVYDDLHEISNFEMDGDVMLQSLDSSIIVDLSPSVDQQSDSSSMIVDLPSSANQLSQASSMVVDLPSSADRLSQASSMVFDFLSSANRLSQASSMILELPCSADRLSQVSSMILDFLSSANRLSQASSMILELPSSADRLSQASLMVSDLLSSANRLSQASSMVLELPSSSNQQSDSSSMALEAADENSVVIVNELEKYDESEDLVIDVEEEEPTSENMDNLSFERALYQSSIHRVLGDRSNTNRLAVTQATTNAQSPSHLNSPKVGTSEDSPRTISLTVTDILKHLGKIEHYWTSMSNVVELEKDYAARSGMNGRKRRSSETELSSSNPAKRSKSDIFKLTRFCESMFDPNDKVDPIFTSVRSSGATIEQLSRALKFFTSEAERLARIEQQQAIEQPANPDGEVENSELPEFNSSPLSNTVNPSAIIPDLFPMMSHLHCEPSTSGIDIPAQISLPSERPKPKSPSAGKLASFSSRKISVKSRTSNFIKRCIPILRLGKPPGFSTTQQPHQQTQALPILRLGKPSESSTTEQNLEISESNIPEQSDRKTEVRRKPGLSDCIENIRNIAFTKMKRGTDSRTEEKQQEATTSSEPELLNTPCTSKTIKVENNVIWNSQPNQDQPISPESNIALASCSQYPSPCRSRAIKEEPSSPNDRDEPEGSTSKSSEEQERSKTTKKPQEPEKEYSSLRELLNEPMPPPFTVYTSGIPSQAMAQEKISKPIYTVPMSPIPPQLPLPNRPRPPLLFGGELTPRMVMDRVASSLARASASAAAHSSLARASASAAAHTPSTSTIPPKVESSDVPTTRQSYKTSKPSSSGIVLFPNVTIQNEDVGHQIDEQPNSILNNLNQSQAIISEALSNKDSNHARQSANNSQSPTNRSTPYPVYTSSESQPHQNRNRRWTTTRPLATVAPVAANPRRNLPSPPPTQNLPNWRINDRSTSPQHHRMPAFSIASMMNLHHELTGSRLHARPTPTRADLFRAQVLAGQAFADFPRQGMSPLLFNIPSPNSFPGPSQFRPT